MNTTEILGALTAIAGMWHIFGFAFGFVYIRFCLKSLFGIIPYDRQWSPVIRSADLHLWLSGALLIVLGCLQKGFYEYLSNPKLWCKITVVIIWFLSTQAIRHWGIQRLKEGDLTLMTTLSAINISCWIYGTFLGCAKSLAYGVVSYVQFFAGFIFIMLFSFFFIYKMKKKHTGHST